MIDELDFMKEEIPRWNEVLRRETEARRAVSCSQREGEWGWWRCKVEMPAKRGRSDACRESENGTSGGARDVCP